MAAVAIHELEVVTEHADQMFLQAHHQRMHPAVEDHIGPLPTHLRRIAGRHVLHVQRRADHGTGDAEALGAVALHLGAEHQLRRCLGHRLFHRQVVVADQRLQPQLLGHRPHLPRQLAAVGAQAHHLEAELLTGDAGGGDGMGGVAKDEHPLAGEIGGIHRAGIPGQTGALFCFPPGLATGGGLQAQQLVKFVEECCGGADADRHGLHRRHAEAALQPAANRAGQLRIKADVGVGVGDAPQVRRAGLQRRHHVHLDAVFGEQPADLAHVIAAAEAQQAGSQQVDPRSAALRLPAIGGGLGAAGRRDLVFQQSPHQLIQGLGRAPVLLF